MLGSMIPSESKWSISCLINSWSSLLNCRDLLAIGWHSGSKFANSDGSSIEAVARAQTGVGL